MSRILPLLTVLFASPVHLFAQGGPPADLRAYTHLFVAYAIVWILLGGWVVSIARRLSRLETRLDDGADHH